MLCEGGIFVKSAVEDRGGAGLIDLGVGEGAGGKSNMRSGCSASEKGQGSHVGRVFLCLGF
jgi:hypothetical protein